MTTGVSKMPKLSAVNWVTARELSPSMLLAVRLSLHIIRLLLSLLSLLPSLLSPFNVFDVVACMYSRTSVMSLFALFLFLLLVFIIVFTQSYSKRPTQYIWK